MYFIHSHTYSFVYKDMSVRYLETPDMIHVECRYLDIIVKDILDMYDTLIQICHF